MSLTNALDANLRLKEQDRLDLSEVFREVAEIGYDPGVKLCVDST